MVPQRQAVDVDGLVLPLAGEAELSPGADVLLLPARPLRPPAGAVPPAKPLRTEDAVELLHGEVCERVVLVHDDAVAGLPAGDVVRTGRQLDLDGRTVLVALEHLLLRESDLAADADISVTEGERGHCRERGLHLVIDARIGLVLAEGRFPVRTQRTVGDVVAAADADCAAHFLLRLVMGQRAEIELVRVGHLLAARRHHPGPGRLHVQTLGGFFRGERRGNQQSNAQRCLDHWFTPVNRSSFFSSSRAASAVSGRYLPSRCTSSCASLLSTKRMNSRVFASMRVPGLTLTQSD